MSKIDIVFQLIIIVSGISILISDNPNYLGSPIGKEVGMVFIVFGAVLLFYEIYKYKKKKVKQIGIDQYKLVLESYSQAGCKNIIDNNSFE